MRTEQEDRTFHKVGQFLANEWDLKVSPLGEDLHPGIDYEWYADGEMIAIGTLISSPHPSTFVPAWYVPVSTYNVLLERSLTAPAVYGMASPVAYVVFRFSDPSLWCLDIAKVDTQKVADDEGTPVYVVTLSMMERMDIKPTQ